MKIENCLKNSCQDSELKFLNFWSHIVNTTITNFFKLTSDESKSITIKYCV